MSGYLKLLVPLAALAFLAFRYQLLMFPVQPPAPAAAAVPAAHHVDAAVETVRAGSLPGFESATVGNAFERRFRNAQWSSFQTPDGVTIVNFHGTILADALSSADLNASHVNQIVLRSNCVQSLAEGATTGQEANREAKIRTCIANVPVAVNFQFTLSADRQKFELSYIDKEPFGEAAPNAVLAFVYRQ